MKRKKAIVSIICIFVAAVIAVAGVLFYPLNGKEHIEIWAKSDSFDLDSIQTVEKDKDKPFNILLLSDTQLWTSPAQNKECFEQIKSLVEKTSPNLIVLAGDNVSGITARFDIKKLISFLDSFKIPWAPVFGNHDDEIPMNSLNWQGDKYEESKYCLFKKGPSNLYGCGNYVINITENDKVIETLFLLDNGRYLEYSDDVKKETYVGYEQMAWYKWNLEGIKSAAGKTVPSMIFTHFAPPEMSKAVEEYSSFDESTGTYTVKNEYGGGICKYLPSSAPVNSGFFDLCLELESTKNMFFGHDHENNAWVTYKGITMSYGMKTGVSPMPWNFAEEMGGTLITLDTKAGETVTTFEHIVIAYGGKK